MHKFVLKFRCERTFGEVFVTIVIGHVVPLNYSPVDQYVTTVTRLKNFIYPA